MYSTLPQLEKWSPEVTEIKVTQRDRELFAEHGLAHLLGGDAMSPEAQEWVRTGNCTEPDVAEFLANAVYAVSKARAEGLAAGSFARVTREKVDAILAAHDRARGDFDWLIGATLDDGRVMSSADVQRLVWHELLKIALADSEPENG